MARLPRLSVAGYPHWVMARGNNGQPVYLSDADRQLFVDLLAQLCRQHAIALHAYVLLGNQFMLLLTPATDAALPAFMQALGRSYVQAFNRTHARTGTLWEGRYRSTVLEPATHLLACMSWMDSSAVRAGLVAQAGDYAWSSCRHYLGRQHQAFIGAHPQTWTLGNTPFAREAAYGDLLHAGLTADMARQFDEQAGKGWILGSAAFAQELQKLTQRRLLKARPGRPPKHQQRAV